MFNNVWQPLERHGGNHPLVMLSPSLSIDSRKVNIIIERLSVKHLLLKLLRKKGALSYSYTVSLFIPFLSR